jgi:hypothetical protein
MRQRAGSRKISLWEVALEAVSEWDEKPSEWSVVILQVIEHALVVYLPKDGHFSA